MPPVKPKKQAIGPRKQKKKHPWRVWVDHAPREHIPEPGIRYDARLTKLNRARN